jgi:hypothetical protein
LVILYWLMIAVTSLPCNQSKGERILRALRRRLKALGDDSRVSPERSQERYRLVWDRYIGVTFPLSGVGNGKDGPEENSTRSGWRGAILWIFVGLLFVNALVSDFSEPVLSAEVLHVKGQVPRVVNVLSRDSSSLTVLYAGTMQIDRVPQSTVISDTFCEEPPVFAGSSIIYRIGYAGGHTPACPR